MNSKVKKFLREPLVLFLLIGSVFYFLQAMLITPGIDSRKLITVSSDQLKQLESGFTKTWMRPPTPGEFEGLIADHVKNEVFYREALAMGLAEKDQVVRNRMRQKLELLMDNMASVNVPSQQMLEVYLQENADEFKEDYQLSFVQVFINPQEHSDPQNEALKILNHLQDGANPEELGDRTMMGYVFYDYSQTDVARRFGTQFASQISQVETGQWSSPLNSSIGLHLIRIDHFQKGTMPELSKIQQIVEREWMANQKREVKALAYKKLLEGYDIQIDKKGDVK